MKKLIACLLAFLVLTGCTGKTETQFKEYDVPSGEHKVIELMNVPVDMTEYQGFTDTDHNSIWMSRKTNNGYTIVLDEACTVNSIQKITAINNQLIFKCYWNKTLSFWIESINQTSLNQNLINPELSFFI